LSLRICTLITAPDSCRSAMPAVVGPAGAAIVAAEL
jgi:hypothetical protein